jgi:hypothetical protein
MNTRWNRITCTALATLALLLACKRSVSTPPPSPSLALNTATPALLAASPTAAREGTGLSPYPGETPIESNAPEPVTPEANGEVPVIPIPLEEPLSRPDAEISGLAWHAGELILLPQYPDRYGDGQTGAVFAIPQADILAFLDGSDPGPLQARRVEFIAPGIRERLPGYEGFEAIAIDGDRVFLTIETRPGEMMGYLVSGLIAADNSTIALDLSTMAPIPPQASIPNFSDEALLVFGNRLISLYEANGSQVNPGPVAHLFDEKLSLQDNLPFPGVEYRITDATPADEYGRFWAINIYNPDDKALQTAADPLAEEYGEGLTHQNSQIVERLVQFQFSEDGIVLAETPPIQLVLSNDGEARNWEAITPFQGRGFLIATDNYPTTILAFIEYSDQMP